MHWLPLVAMVIASALLYSQCPVPKLVAATMEPGINNSTNSSADYNSSDYHQHYNSNAQYTENAHHRAADSRGPSDLKDNSLPSSLRPEKPSSKRRQSPKARLAGGDTGRAEEHTGLVFQDQTQQTLHRSQDNHILTDYKSQRDQLQDHNHFEISSEGVGTRRKNTLRKDKARPNNGEELTITSTETSTGRDQLLDGQSTVGGAELDGVGGEAQRGGAMPAEGLDFEDEELLESHPRVLFSTSPTPPKHPPLQLLLESGLLPDDYVEEEEEEEEEELEEEDDEGQSGGDGEQMQVEKAGELRQQSYRNLLLGLSVSDRPGGAQQRPRRASRRKRQLDLGGPERSVCESVSNWVMGRRVAVDSHGENVTVLDKFPTKKGMLTQYFFETKCRGPDHRGARGEHGLAGSGCLGVDKKHWVSECRTKQAFVRAFTSDNRRGTGWRWIRIDLSCVCVLYSRNHKRRGIR
ncbi:uncharacterized protein ntf4 [Brachyhypopomus gauderio]|uniref:uncharacterized protein ntf4 n=1 Tax=Brachyhypopomus gauderio TaxID=698409 RepID=UPI00404270D5